MSLLHQESQEDIDDAARGEEFTKGSSNLVVAGSIAVVLVSVAIGLYMWLGQTPPVASGVIVQVWAHPGHVVSSGFDANGAPMAKETVDQVLIFAHVKLRNESKNPLQMENILANANLGNVILSVSAGSAAQYEEVFLAYPEVAAMRSTVLKPQMTIAPGENVEGTAFWVVRMTKQEWEARKDLSFTFKFQYQPSLVLTPRTVTEQ